MDSLSALEILYCCAVLLVAYSLRGSTGFGGVGMPLLSLLRGAGYFVVGEFTRDT